jgi:hypothetical protein
MASDTFSSRVRSSDADTSSRRRLAIGFLNWAHALATSWVIANGVEKTRVPHPVPAE